MTSPLSPARPDGRQMNTLLALRERLKRHVPRLRFDPDFTAPQHAEWKEQVRGKLRELMLLPFEFATPPRLVEESPRAGYTLQKWEFYPDQWSVFPVLLLLPDAARQGQRVPLVLCTPGSNHTKERLAGEPEPANADPTNRNPEQNAMALHYLRQGYAAIALDHPMMGECGGENDPNRSSTCWHLVWMGQSYEALATTYLWHVLQWGRAQSFVDPARVALSGHSLGTKYALITTVLAGEAVSALVYNDFYANWQERRVVTDLRLSGWWHTVPGLIEWFDYSDLMAAVAPTPLLISEGGRACYLEQLRALYERLGASHSFDFAHYPEYADPRDRLYDDTPIPEHIDNATYLRYCNVAADSHWFKANVALPWLATIFAKGNETGG